MTTTFVIVVLLGAIFYFSEKAKHEKKNREIIERDNRNEQSLLRHQINVSETEKRILQLLAAIETFILKETNTLRIHKVTKREINISRGWSKVDRRNVEKEYKKSVIDVMDESMAYSVYLYEDFVKMSQLQIDFHITEMDITQEMISGSSTVTFNDFAERTDDELFQGFIKVYNEAVLKMEENLKYYHNL